MYLSNSAENGEQAADGLLQMEDTGGGPLQYIHVPAQVTLRTEYTSRRYQYLGAQADW
jgi:hypothetical protein